MKATLKPWSYRSKETEKMDATYSELDEHPLLGVAANAAIVLCALLGMGPRLCMAGTPRQTAFPSPDEAGRALVSTVQQQDERSVFVTAEAHPGMARAKSPFKTPIARCHRRFDHSTYCLPSYCNLANSDSPEAHRANYKAEKAAQRLLLRDLVCGRISKSCDMPQRR